MDKNYYDVLGVSKNASQDDIKRAFKKKSKEFHPDINKEPGAEEKFKEVNEAYQVLSDPEKKQMYDTYGTTDPNEAFQNGGGFNPFMRGFSSFGAGFNPFGGMGGQKPKERGDDLKITIEMDFDELFYGAHKKVKINKKCTCHRCNGSGSESNDTQECPYCHGSGYVTQVYRQGNMMSQSMSPCPHCHGTGTIVKDPCPNCNGTGLEYKNTEVEFDVPPGMYENAYFMVIGKGNDGPHRGIPGDLLVIVKEKPNTKGLKRDDENNILYTAKVPYKDLVFGTDIEIPYIGSNKKIHIEQGTESGKKVKLFRMGFPDPHDINMKADYIVTIECLIPKEKDLSKEEKKKIKEL